jgi:hypothetical protein
MRTERVKGKVSKAEMDEDDFHAASLRPRPLKKGEDFYMDGAAMVFTASYHLRRGSCCESGCRHCPFRGAAESQVESCEVRIDAEKKDASL